MQNLSNQQNDLYSPVMATIQKVEALTRTERRFQIALPGGQTLSHKPGQFVEVSIFGFGEAPISISSSPMRKSSFDLTVRRTGRLTNKMHELSEGSRIGIRGPFGNGFDVDAFKGHDMLFICGGIGLAPLKSLIDYTIENKNNFGRIIVLYGTKSPSEILFPKEIAAWQADMDVEFMMTVDRGTLEWNGNTGVITTLIPSLKLNVQNTIATVVGPPVMYKFVLMALKSRNILDDNIYLSLERRMKCGVGKCGHCQINNSYVCQDGPVYHYPHLIELEEAV